MSLMSFHGLGLKLELLYHLVRDPDVIIITQQFGNNLKVIIISQRIIN